MKSLIKKLVNTNFFVFLRNTVKFKSVYLQSTKLNTPTTISDAFLWRTDNGYKTIFKYTDILEIFYNLKNSWVEIHIFTKENKLLKKIKYNDLKISNEFEITPEYLNGLEDYGVFYIYHLTNKNIGRDNIISNRCYLGYSRDKNMYSFVHGNTLAKYSSIYSNKKIYSNIVKTSLFKNQEYTIQKYFKDFDNNELFFSNPTDKTIRFSLKDKNYKLKSGHSISIDTNEPLVTIKSNCLFLRPTVFSYKKNFFDVHHS